MERPNRRILKPIPDYGVLKGTAVNKSRGKRDDGRHLATHVTAGKKHYRLSINVRSGEGTSEILYLVNENFDWKHLQELKGLIAGFTALDERDEMAVDYVRSGMFDPAAMRPLLPNLPGRQNAFEALAEKYIDLAIAKPGAMVYAFGRRFCGPKSKDPYFGFSPQAGVHDIHMNQGNAAKFQDDDGVFQDGALLIDFPEEQRWIAIFVAFRSQSTRTDDRTGRRHAAATAAASAGGRAAEPAGRAQRRR